MRFFGSRATPARRALRSRYRIACGKSRIEVPTRQMLDARRLRRTCAALARIRYVGIVVALAASATPASAHAVLTKTSVRDRPVKADTATPVTLTFNSGIETGFAQVVLARRRARIARSTARAGDKPSDVVVDLPPLPPGAYALRYKVLAADGHVTESVFRFRVDRARSRAVRAGLRRLLRRPARRRHPGGAGRGARRGVFALLVVPRDAGAADRRAARPRRRRPRAGRRAAGRRAR